MNRRGESATCYGYTDFRMEQHHRMLLPFLEQVIPKQKSLTILDVGCGTGVVADALAKAGHDVVGVDVAEDAIAIARKSVPNVRFELGSAYEISSVRAPRDGAWDVVLAVEVIEHLYSPQTFFKLAKSVLKPTGQLIVTTPYHGFAKNLALALFNAWDRHLTVHREGGHIKFFSKNTLSAMVEDCGFGRPTFRFAGRAPWLWKSMIAYCSPSCVDGNHAKGDNGYAAE